MRAEFILIFVFFFACWWCGACQNMPVEFSMCLEFGSSIEFSLSTSAPAQPCPG
jgi:hypothetical protein